MPGIKEVRIKANAVIEIDFIKPQSNVTLLMYKTLFRYTYLLTFNFKTDTIMSFFMDLDPDAPPTPWFDYVSGNFESVLTFIYEVLHELATVEPCLGEKTDIGDADLLRIWLQESNMALKDPSMGKLKWLTTNWQTVIRYAAPYIVKSNKSNKRHRPNGDG